jgi:CBS domain-containing protein
MEHSHYVSAGGILVGDVMTHKVVKVGIESSVLDVGNLLAQKRISGAVVYDGDSIAGVISKEGFVMGVKYMGARPLDSFVVRDFMCRFYETASPGEPLDVVVERMLASPLRVDRVLVLEDGVLVGILTTGDVARVFWEHGAGCFRVRDLMQLNPPVVYDYARMSEIMREITLSRDKKVIVMSGRRVLGMITVLDLSLALFEKLKEHSGKDAMELITLEDIITLDPITITEKEDAAVAAGIMAEKRVGGLPVYNMGLKGIITKNDFLKGWKALKDAKKLGK